MKNRESIQQKIAKRLVAKGQTLSVAESCTGGQISHLITMESGSSAYYLGSVTSYAIEVKEKVLGVPTETIEEHGVVSVEVALAMAEGVQKLTGSTYSVATTGLAEGGNDKYPEGTVCIAACGKENRISRIFHCDKGRKGNIRRFATEALHLLEHLMILEENN